MSTKNFALHFLMKILLIKKKVMAWYLRSMFFGDLKKEIIEKYWKRLSCRVDMEENYVFRKTWWKFENQKWYVYLFLSFGSINRIIKCIFNYLKFLLKKRIKWKEGKVKAPRPLTHYGVSRFSRGFSKDLLKLIW